MSTANGFPSGLNYTTGASANRIADDFYPARDHRRPTEVEDLFAQWESDPLLLQGFADLAV